MTILYLVGLAAFVSTFLGGTFALRLRDKLHLILGFSAGAVVAIAFFDLLPESLTLTHTAYSSHTVLSITALGFMLYLAIDRLFLLHGHTGEDHDAQHADHARGTAGAGSLSFHSFLDGVGIGLAFQVSPVVGGVVTAAVLAHDFSDGINTVNFIVKNGGTKKEARKWLFIDALTPSVGIFFTTLFSVQEHTLGLLLALFGGFFLYIGASDLIPESYHAHPIRWTTYSTILGMGILYIIIHLAG